MRLMATEIAEFDFVLYSGCVRRGVHFCGWGGLRPAPSQVARNGHRATRDVRRTTEEQALREALHFRPRWGRRRLKLNASLRHDETSLCSRSPGVLSIKTSPVCTPVPQTVSGPPVTGGQARALGGHVSLWHNIERGCMAQRPWWVVARRRESDQAKGRHPYLPTGASVLRRSLHTHKSGDKGA